jgi:hypothetical protein
LASLGLASPAEQDVSAKPASDEYQQHALFSVYVHTTAGALLPHDSVLSGCELPVRLNTTRGYAQHVLTEAAALLLRAALSDPLNAKFVLVSDTSLPIYPPQVTPQRILNLQTCMHVCSWHQRRPAEALPCVYTTDGWQPCLHACTAQHTRHKALCSCFKR